MKRKGLLLLTSLARRHAVAALWIGMLAVVLTLIGCGHGGDHTVVQQPDGDAGMEAISSRVEQAKALLPQLEESGKLGHSSVDFLVETLGHPDPLQSRAALSLLVAMVDANPELADLAVSLALNQAVRARDVSERAFWVGTCEMLLQRRNLLHGKLLDGMEPWEYEAKLAARSRGQTSGD